MSASEFKNKVYEAVIKAMDEGFGRFSVVSMVDLDFAPLYPIQTALQLRRFQENDTSILLALRPHDPSDWVRLVGKLRVAALPKWRGFSQGDGWSFALASQSVHAAKDVEFFQFRGEWTSWGVVKEVTVKVWRPSGADLSRPVQLYYQEEASEIEKVSRRIKEVICKVARIKFSDALKGKDFKWTDAGAQNIRYFTQTFSSPSAEGERIWSSIVEALEATKAIKKIETRDSHMFFRFVVPRKAEVPQARIFVFWESLPREEAADSAIRSSGIVDIHHRLEQGSEEALGNHSHAPRRVQVFKSKPVY
ncbi:hypothetical protein T439DRAFT_360327 [Meredithblackwellia eburnea MCA 4105]